MSGCVCSFAHSFSHSFIQQVPSIFKSKGRNCVLQLSLNSFVSNTPGQVSFSSPGCSGRICRISLAHWIY